MATSAPDDPRLLYHLGNRLQSAGQTAKAFDTLSRAADLQPHELEIWHAAANSARLLNGPRAALNILTGFAQTNPGNSEVHILLAKLYAEEGSYRNAFREATSATELNPKNAEAWRLKGQAAVSAERLTDGIEALQRAVALEPGNDENYFWLGNGLTFQQRWDEAVTAYHQAARLTPDKPALMISLARALLAQQETDERTQEAIDLLSHCVQKEPENPTALLYYGRALARQQHWTEAKTALEQSVRLEPSLGEPYFDLVRIYQKLNDPVQAAEAQRKHADYLRFIAWQNDTLHKIQQAGGDSVAGRNLQEALASEYMRQKRYAQAAQQYRHLLETSPERTDLKEAFNRASQLSLPLSDLLKAADDLRRKEQWKAAVDAYLQALERDQSNALAWEGAGLALANQGQLVTAFKYLAQAVRLDPTRVEARIALAQANLMQGLPSEALVQLEGVVKVDTANAPAWHLLGVVRNHLGKRPAAEEAFGRAAILDDKNPSFQMDWADALLADKRMAEAETAYRKALSLAPDQEETESRFGGFLLNFTAPEKRAEAGRLLEAVAKKYPEDTYARYNLARLLSDDGKYAETIALIEPVIDKMGGIETKEVWYALERAYAKVGREADARRASEKVRKLIADYERFTVARERVQMNPTNFPARLELARCRAERGEYARALGEYKSILRREPANATALTEEKALESRLKAEGKMPDMGLYETLVVTSEAYNHTPKGNK